MRAEYMQTSKEITQPTAYPDAWLELYYRFRGHSMNLTFVNAALYAHLSAVSTLQCGGVSYNRQQHELRFFLSHVGDDYTLAKATCALQNLFV